MKIRQLKVVVILKYFILINFILVLISSKSFSLGLVQVNSLNDTTITYVPGSNIGNASNTTNFCVGMINLLGPYTIKFTSSNGSGTIFRVKNSSNNYVPYSVFYYTNANGSGTENQMNSGVVSGNFNLLALGICLLGNNNSMKILFNSSDLNSAFAGTYTDILTISISAV